MAACSTAMAEAAKPVNLLCPNLAALHTTCSCKLNHQGRSMERSVQHFVQAMQSLKQIGGAHSILLVSGGGQKLKQFEAVQVLDQLQPCKGACGPKQQTLIPSAEPQAPLPIHCAFNPYLAGEAAEVERRRLQAKLCSGVAGVYLQIGMCAGCDDRSHPCLAVSCRETAASKLNLQHGYNIMAAQWADRVRLKKGFGGGVDRLLDQCAD